MYSHSIFCKRTNFLKCVKLKVSNLVLSKKLFKSFSKIMCVQRPYSISTNKEEEKCYDLVIVGGGIVGMATAQELKSRITDLRMAVLEKESKLGAHQSGHNSGVIHAGIYYKPGSLRAKLCVEGMRLTYKYCDKHNIPYKKCGKLIVATNEVEVKRLDELVRRGIENQVPDMSVVMGSRIKDIEPHCKGLKAIHSPHTGIIDWGLMTQKYGSEFEKMGGEILLNFNVQNFGMAKENSGDGTNDLSKFPILIHGSRPDQKVRAGHVLTCGGLYSDKLAEMTGDNPEPKIIPFRGEYLVLSEEKKHLVNGNIYPVPDPSLPFLGVHFTPRINGDVWLGPNAMLAFKKEGYRLTDFNLKELMEIVTYRGLQRFILKYFTKSLSEVRRSMLISEQVKELQKFIPTVQTSDVKRGPTGVRAQAMDVDGNLVEDFIFGSDRGGRILHCRNAPSPAATSSLAIGKFLADKVQKELLGC